MRLAKISSSNFHISTAMLRHSLKTAIPTTGHIAAPAQMANPTTCHIAAPQMAKRTASLIAARAQPTMHTASHIVANTRIPFSLQSICSTWY
ncbi:hypothetical protein EGR_10247 [Echinococcus granulosus]|uniref:Uncharacterized protein n=1 Tax=Echinococcus granulosus TaxID=6210 RepID=W6U2U2_ECHGR|nr:hypothetical protein EGR_10247 [Echinococcus granulosus]EUB54886.1 hypothetical protein EGR_10247 [Echinococcus granulosus]